MGQLTSLPKIPGYAIEALAGQGAFGAVFRARAERLGRQVAIKILFHSGPADVARFIREGKALSRISHPCCVEVYDLDALPEGVPGAGTPYLVLEWIDGESLKERLLHPPRPSQLEIVTWGMLVAQGLQQAHDAKILHRDLKPANVLLPREGGAKITDFGLSLLTEEHTRLTEAGVIVGTPLYVSPEAAAGLDSDHRADLYALGVMLHEMLAGAPPFRAQNPMALLTMHVTAPPRPLRMIAPEIDARLEALVLKLLSKRPDDRHPSARAVEIALADIARRLAAAEKTPDTDAKDPAQRQGMPGAARTDLDAATARDLAAREEETRAGSRERTLVRPRTKEAAGALEPAAWPAAWPAAGMLVALSIALVGLAVLARALSPEHQVSAAPAPGADWAQASPRATQPASSLAFPPISPRGSLPTSPPASPPASLPTSLPTSPLASPLASVPALPLASVAASATRPDEDSPVSAEDAARRLADALALLPLEDMIRTFPARARRTDVAPGRTAWLERWRRRLGLFRGIAPAVRLFEPLRDRYFGSTHVDLEPKRRLYLRIEALREVEERLAIVAGRQDRPDPDVVPPRLWPSLASPLYGPEPGPTIAGAAGCVIEWEPGISSRTCRGALHALGDDPTRVRRLVVATPGPHYLHVRGDYRLEALDAPLELPATSGALGEVAAGMEVASLVSDVTLDLPSPSSVQAMELHACMGDLQVGDLARVFVGAGKSPAWTLVAQLWRDAKGPVAGVRDVWLGLDPRLVPAGSRVRIDLARLEGLSDAHDDEMRVSPAYLEIRWVGR